jgi:hypothetical protein
MRVLELGNYVVPAFAGMILAEQGHAITKWTNGKDPILGLNRGEELWAWINHGKTLAGNHPRELLDADPGRWDVILDNFRPATLDRWGIDPARQAARLGVRWVSMRADAGAVAAASQAGGAGDRSFDLIAQARSWMEYAPWVPFWAGDTIGGLWLAFKALAVSEPGHYAVEQAGCMQKLVEGELCIDAPREPGRIPWETETYRFDPERREAVVEYKGETVREPVRDRAWKLAHLRHRDGRIVI